MSDTGKTSLPFLEGTGKLFSSTCFGMGRCGILFYRACVGVCRRPFRFKQYADAFLFIGNHSMLIVSMTGAFTGMVLALQMFESLRRFNSESVVSGIVGLALTKELGPVLTALMVNSRAGSAIAAHLGTMRVTEQIDALESMAVDSVQFLVSPRLVAGMVCLPLLTAFANVIGVLGGYLIAVVLLGLDHGLYVAKLIDLVAFTDVAGGLIKSFFFGLILTLIGCYQGYFASKGAEGVGQATTRAVVISSVMILFFDYTITSFLIVLGL